MWGRGECCELFGVVAEPAAIEFGALET